MTLLSTSEHFLATSINLDTPSLLLFLILPTNLESFTKNGYPSIRYRMGIVNA